MDPASDRFDCSVGDQHRGGPASVGMPNAPSTTANPFDEPQRRMSEYTAQDIATLQARLDKKLGPEYISNRPGAGGQKVHYLSADKCINLANEVFGFNGWSSSIQKIDIDFIDENQNSGRVTMGLSVVMRVTLKDGTYHEDIGYGHIENAKGKAAAFEKSKKEATTDALKRSLRNFGNVLGNCVYDKDYLAKVTKVKSTPARFDVEELHRHRDFAPKPQVSKPQALPAKRVAEDDLLPPPRPVEPQAAKSSNAMTSGSFDGDGEFGSDLFDEADFAVGTTGNPDEITIETEAQRQPPTPHESTTASERASGRKIRQHRYTIKTRKVEPRESRRQTTSAPKRSTQPLSYACSRPTYAPEWTSKCAKFETRGATSIKTEPAAGLNQDPQPPPGSQSVGFFSARVADMLRDNPNAGPVPGSQFDPHAESPSIRKTAGVDHTKSVPISRPMLSNASPAPSNSRDFVNPATDFQRRVGAPGGVAGSPGVGSPLSRGPSTSTFRPLTRPNIDARPAPNAATIDRASVPPQNMNGKRPPLNDVTNASPGANLTAAPLAASPTDPKRPRVSDVGQHQPPQPQAP
ncbi:Rad52/22 double-strand break repair protein [Penicillium manginii]|uniref:Rad52/22 double-strand break repair protein n=1 Tax=Penicillium manginii TaxID=203109 RepID=UPI002547B592|nr:Rad52/22 double-strand break repair protein [Penicillium manginii]KAJ5763873.1 Rad52/22 double-strand break repair protein [Penicillium manginii]